MYMMLRLPTPDQLVDDAGVTDDVSFVLKFWDEESVLLLPSQCFFEKGFARVVTCISRENAVELGVRLSRFMERILKPQE